MIPLISCVMNTYRRFTCVNRSIRLFLDQETGAFDTELIIYNTDTEYPLILAPGLPANIRVVNNGTDQRTTRPYMDIGSVRRDSLAHAWGQYYICWDDDDIFLPWHIQQCVDGIMRHQCWAWKPFTSMFWRAGGPPELACNNMEASILIDLERLRDAGFCPHQGGGEHLQWLNLFQSRGKMTVDQESVPSYCFNWHDTGIARGHKQSGTIDRADNFEYHKRETKDVATGPLTGAAGAAGVEEIYREHAKVIAANVGVKQNTGHVIRANVAERYMGKFL